MSGRTCIPQGFAWPAGWIPVSEGAAFEKELAREMSDRHPLINRDVVAIAKRLDRDDVLFAAKDGTYFAVVHLTWSSAPDFHPNFSQTTMFHSLEEFASAWAG
jgi:hypothetical protein